MKPGEADRIAAFLGITLEELFRASLEVDYWIDSPNVYLLSPAIVGHPTGAVMEYAEPRGQCVFLDADDRCRIHAVKPFECAGAWCGDGPVDPAGSLHQQAADSWRAPEHQAQIALLLGHAPEEPEAGFFDIFGLLND